MGADAIEMDVVISKDLQVVVSHEPWMNELFCSKPDGSKIEKDSQTKYNLFQMPYSEIRNFDCGKNGNPEFPSQKKFLLINHCFQKL
jgi:glycerophosphoryl diester phosphodiesterase